MDWNLDDFKSIVNLYICRVRDLKNYKVKPNRSKTKRGKNLLLNLMDFYM